MRTPVTRRIALIAATSLLLVAAHASAAIDPVHGRWGTLPPGQWAPDAGHGHAAALHARPYTHGPATMLVLGGTSTWLRDSPLELELDGHPTWGGSWFQWNSGPLPIVQDATLVPMYPDWRSLRAGGSPLTARVEEVWIEEYNGFEGPNGGWFPLTRLPDGLGLSGHAACAPPGTHQMYVFGGLRERAGQAPARTDGLWRFDDDWRHPDDWHTLAPTGDHPAARAGHSMVFDVKRDRLLVFGGDTLDAGARVALGDTWAYSIADGAWSLLAATGPARGGHLAFYDPQRDRMVVFGGRDATGRALADVWALSLAEDAVWTRLVPEGGAPPARSSSAGVYDPASDRLVFFGGVDSTGADLGDTWWLEFGQPAAPALAFSVPATALSGQHVRVRGIATSRLAVADTLVLRITSGGELAVRSVPLEPGQSDSVECEWTITDRAPEYEMTLTFGAAGTRVAMVARSQALTMRVAPLTAQPAFESDGERVLLTWEIGGVGAPDPTVERRIGAGDWVALGPAAIRGGLVRFVDADVVPGLSADYRLRFVVDGSPWIRGTVHVEVPTSTAPRVLAIEGATANPAAGTLSVRLALPAGETAVVEVLDVSGRRVARRDVGATSAERHLIAFPEVTRPGLYLVRARQGGIERVRRMSVIR